MRCAAASRTGIPLLMRQNPFALRRQLAQGFVGLRRIGRLAVPEIVALHVGYTFAWNRVGNDDLWSALETPRALRRRDELRNIVAIALEDFPVERSIFLRKRLERHNVLRAAVDLDEVAIDDGGQVVQFELC